MIPSPKLDDRQFQDIVDEALRLIPRYAPEWTNHNPSDPGITLIELAAWMTDLILFRLNRVPEKNYIAFLNLLGIKLKPPRAAWGLIQFNLVEGASRQRVPAGTQVATPQGTEEQTVTFEIERDLTVTDVVLDRVFSYFNDTYSDNSPFLDGSRGQHFEVFGGAERVERYLYLSDARFANAGDSSVLRLFLGCPERGGRDLARLLEWEYWNGDRWKEMMPAPVEVDRGEVCFFGPMNFEPVEVDGIEGLWLRGRLAEVPDDPEETEIDTVRARIEVVGEGVLPDRAIANLENAFILLDTGKNMYPFGKEPGVDCVLYLCCEELLQTADAYLSLELVLADAGAIPRPAPSEELVLAWEYFDGKRWQMLGRSNARGILPGAGDEFGFHDETRALAQSGSVSFRRPKNMEPSEVNGEEARWLRVRIEKGDYGEAGNYTLDGDKWVFKEDRPLRPPALKSLTFRYREDYREVRHALAYNDFAYNDFSELARTDYTIFQPFTPQADESPALYLGFDKPLPNESSAIYFQMAEELGLSAIGDEDTDVLTAELSRYNAERSDVWSSEQRVVWEYWNGELWAPLVVTDETQAFTKSGFVELVASDDWAQCMKFTEERHWLRARLEMGGYVKAPRIRRILTNVVGARNHITIRDEILGSSDASPMQHFALLRTPLLEGEVIVVRERQAPPADEVAALGEDAVTPVSEESDEVWVRWQRVDSFFESGPRSRHYVIDYQNGGVHFGDGRKGMMPPEGANNIVARRYQIGGGATGNVNAGTLTSLNRALSYIDSVTNPIPATGGADRETVDEAKDRAPYTIKSRDRAVTAEDFEMLALRASTSIARAKCVPDRSNRGAVTLVVMPKAEPGMRGLTRRLMPSNEILRYIKNYLDERRLVGTILRVIKPRYRDISLKVTLLRRTVGTSDRLRREIADKLRTYLHPLVGGRDGKGWEFGRAVLKTELVHMAEEVPGVEGVDALEILDEERRVHVEHVRVEDDELPFLVHVHIVEKVRDEIM
ncbi:putative baseplate assembly protein [Haliangium sp.]|uniref:putative baseplate assembly protein n=1 Tax=Haliangium sp. TaxID=2663208 RepID=UPI003D0B9DC0